MTEIPETVKNAPFELVLAAFAAVACDDPSLCIPIGEAEGIKAIDCLYNTISQIPMDVDIAGAAAWLRECMNLPQS